MRPALFVELGTHTGESFFAFCQAIREGNVQCKAYSVDTWRGDIHTGSYGEQVFSEVEAYRASHYGSFTSLLRMTFDEAVKLFEDESIDLLHIDGEHTYEVVRHDFDNWWPKVRPGGVVALHDSFERQHDFGVWKLMEELRGTLPVGEFCHSHGLGVVLKPGPETSNHVAEALVRTDERSRSDIRRYYEVCAQHLAWEFADARSQRPPECDVTSQLSWRKEGEPFEESSSVRLAHVVTAEWGEAVLPLPPSVNRNSEFRLDLALAPALLEVRDLSVVDASGKVLRRWSVRECFQELCALGLHALLSAEAESALILDTPAGSQLGLPLSTAAEGALQTGGSVVCTMRALDADTFAAKLRAAYEHQLSGQTSAVAELTRSLEEVQRKLADCDRSLSDIENSKPKGLLRRLLRVSGRS